MEAQEYREQAERMLGSLPPGADRVHDGINYGRWSIMQGVPTSYWMLDSLAGAEREEPRLSFTEARAALAEALARRERG